MISLHGFNRQARRIRRQCGDVCRNGRITVCRSRVKNLCACRVVFHFQIAADPAVRARNRDARFDKKRVRARFKNAADQLQCARSACAVER